MACVCVVTKPTKIVRFASWQTFSTCHTRYVITLLCHDSVILPHYKIFLHWGRGCDGMMGIISRVS